MARAFQVHTSDNVATLLDDVKEGPVILYGCSADRSVTAVNCISLGHKIALEAIPVDAPIIKYGVPIGRATIAIAPGEWVHLHNCRSEVDERSSHLDLETGAALDTPYV